MQDASGVPGILPRMAAGHVQISDPRVEAYVLDSARFGGDRGIPRGLRALLDEVEGAAAREALPVAGCIAGRTIFLLTGLLGARRIYIGGVGSGYSALWIAAGAGPGASILLVDRDQEHLDQARARLDRLGVQQDREYRVGDPLAAFEHEDGPFDLVFSDVEKGGYARFAQIVEPRLRLGGLYIADKALWYGKVCVGGTTWDAWTTSIATHNRLMFEHPAFFTTIHDQGEGLLVAVKRGR